MFTVQQLLFLHLCCDALLVNRVTTELDRHFIHVQPELVIFAYNMHYHIGAHHFAAHTGGFDEYDSE